jgi:hypothetical protein
MTGRVLWQIETRIDTAANWAAANPILLAGERGIEREIESDTGREKVGDGVTRWLLLPYFGLQRTDPLINDQAQTLTVASNATTLDIATRTGNKYLLTINSTAAFTLTITNFPANPTWWEAEIIITTTQVPSSFTFAGTPAKRDVAGSTLADNPFAADKITSLLLSKIAADRYTAQFAPAVDP